MDRIHPLQMDIFLWIPLSVIHVDRSSRARAYHSRREGSSGSEGRRIERKNAVYGIAGVLGGH